MSSHTISKPLPGAQGYKRLARLVVRAFYNGEVPPKEEEPEQDDGPSISRRRLTKHTFEGLAILLIDHLVKVEGYIDEISIAAELRLSQKNIRRALRYLEGEHIIAAETVKLAFKRQNVEVDDVEVEDKFKRKETRVFWCMDYPRMKDSIQVRLHKVRELLRKHAAGADAVQNYICTNCGSQYSSLDALSLLDMMTGTFRCEVSSCRAELQQHVELQTGAAATSRATDGSARERLAYFEGLLQRLEVQLKPIIDQLEKLKDVEAPDYGSLQDWYQANKEAADRRAKHMEALKKRAAAAGHDITIPEGLTDEQYYEFADRTQFNVALPGAEGSMAASAGQLPVGKEVPLWFQGEGIAPAAGGNGAVSHQMSDDAQTAVSPDEQRRLLEQKYLEEYLRRVRAQAANHGGASTIDIVTGTAAKVEQQQQQQQEQQVLGDDRNGDGDGPTKRLKVEHTVTTVTAVVEVKEEQVKEEEDVKGEDIEWEDADAVRVADQGANDEDDGWEDV